MKGNFEYCLEIILEHEGGFVDHPDDPGGMTNLGITAETYANWHGISLDDIEKHDMIDLNESDVAPIYREKYWNEIMADSLPSGLDLSVFDMAVNAGNRRASRILQSILPRCELDGYIGPITLGIVREEYRFDPETLIEDYAHERESFYKSLHHYKVFGKGWSRRVRETKDISLSMIE